MKGIGLTIASILLILVVKMAFKTAHSDIMLILWGSIIAVYLAWKIPGPSRSKDTDRKN